MIWETVLLALRAIRRNVLRSSLTILGIVIGVAAVITMVTLGGGATAQVTSEISSLGSNMLHVRPGQGMRGPGGMRTSADDFKIEDAQAISREIFGLEAVAPTSKKGAQAIFGNRNWSTSVMGVTNEYLLVRDWPLLNGRVFNENELRSGKTVCIIGTTLRDEIFGDHEPIGEKIRLNKLSCQVIGVLESKGQSSFGNDQDDLVLIPLRAFQRRLEGSTDVKTIYVSALDGISTTTVKEDIERLMRYRRGIMPGKDDDFHVRDMQEIVSTLTSTTGILTALLGAVAAVSLLVGGIGIMNIMLASVLERTREIGIRRATGATRKDVLGQFMIESVMLSFAGGLIGIVLGFALTQAIAAYADWRTIVSIQAIVLSFGVSVGIGVIFGVYPARRAARMDPIEALRYE